MIDTMLINVGFNVSKALHGLILKISQEIRNKYNSDWYLDDVKYHLHFPMYLIPIPMENKQLINEVSEKYSNHCNRLKTEVIDMFFNSSGLLMLKFKLTEDILELHKLSLKYFNPIRGNLLRDKYLSEEYMSKLTEKYKSYVLKYGSEYVLDNYVPHITIARIKDERFQKEIMANYRNKIIGANGLLDRLQVHTAIFSDNKNEDKTVLLFDKNI